MAARAIWKGRLLIGDAALAVKMYSAVQERTVHFRLLDRETLTPVHQRIVRKGDGSEVPKDERRKAVARRSGPVERVIPAPPPAREDAPEDDEALAIA